MPVGVNCTKTTAASAQVAQSEEEEESSDQGEEGGNEEEMIDEEKSSNGKEHEEDLEGSDLVSSDSDELPLQICIIPIKQKSALQKVHKASKILRATTPSSIDQEPEEEIEEPITEEPDEVPEVPKITYNMMIVSLDQARKTGHTQETTARFIVLPSDLDLENVYARLKIKICDVLFPGQVEVPDDAFEVLFSVPQYMPAPVPLETADDYKLLIKNVLKVHNNPLTKITVKQLKLALRVDKENAPLAGKNDLNREVEHCQNGKKAKKSRVGFVFGFVYCD